MTASKTVNRALIAALLILMGLALTREWMQAHMARHMLLQMPALAIAGWWLHRAGGAALQARLHPWNRYGLTGLIFIQCLAAFWMVPRALDLALSSALMELMKYVGWIVAGVLLRQSMRQSNLMVQVFTLGNVLMMVAAVSDIYATTADRLCNFYSIGDQVSTAQGLWVLLAAITAVWALHVWRQPQVLHDRSCQ
jgi:hypothetical protein